MKMNRRTFVAGMAATGTFALDHRKVSAALNGSQVAEPTYSDPLFNEPYIDVDEWRDTPSRHRYVHGGFKGTSAKFLILLPPKEQYEGRFFQHNTAIPVPEEKSVWSRVKGWFS